MISFNVDKASFSVSLSGIETIAVFGSHARGEADQFSDIDLLIIIEDCEHEDYVKKKKLLQKELAVPLRWISLYTKRSILKMNNYSSYFLWHLKLESKIIFSKAGFLEAILSNLKPYSKTESDLLEYLEICKDIRQSINYDNKTFEYELNVLSSLARNTCIAITYMHNQFLFGRIQPVQKSRGILGSQFPFNVEEYLELYNYRIAYNRNSNKLNLRPIKKKYIDSWLNRIEKLIIMALHIWREKQKNV